MRQLNSSVASARKPDNKSRHRPAANNAGMLQRLNAFRALLLLNLADRVPAFGVVKTRELIRLMVYLIEKLCYQMVIIRPSTDSATVWHGLLAKTL